MENKIIQNDDKVLKNDDTSFSYKAIFNKKVITWCVWDLGIAAFNSVVMTFVFTVYLTSEYFGDKVYSSEALGHGLTIAGFLIAVLAPLTGQRADKAGRGTFWLGVNSFLVIACIFGLYFVKPVPSYLWLGIILVSLGSIFSEFAGVNYNAMLRHVSSEKNIGLISGIGWGSGYIGGIILLLTIFVGFISPEVGWFGVTAEDGMNVRVSMLVAGVWMLVMTVPILVVMRTGKVLKPDTSVEKVRIGQAYKQLWYTLKLIKQESPQTFLFLLASAVFRDGLAGVFTFGAVIAAGTFMFSHSDVILFGVLANVVAGIATMIFGYFDDKLGPRKVIFISLICMIISGMCVFIFSEYGQMIFWVFGLTLAIFVGPAQSASRSYLARLIPAGREGEVFGLYATTGRAVSFLAPAAFAFCVGLGNRYFGSQQAQSWGILGIVLILLLGLILMLLVKQDVRYGSNITVPAGVTTMLSPAGTVAGVPMQFVDEEELHKDNLPKDNLGAGGKDV